MSKNTVQTCCSCGDPNAPVCYCESCAVMNTVASLDSNDGVRVLSQHVEALENALRSLVDKQYIFYDGPDMCIQCLKYGKDHEPNCTVGEAEKLLKHEGYE